MMGGLTFCSTVLHATHPHALDLLSILKLCAVRQSDRVQVLGAHRAEHYVATHLSASSQLNQSHIERAYRAHAHNLHKRSLERALPLTLTDLFSLTKRKSRDPTLSPKERTQGEGTYDLPFLS